MLKSNRVAHYVSAMRGRGVDPRQVLMGTGLDLVSLEDSTGLIEEDQCRKVVSNLIRLTGDDSIGFEMGRHSRLSDCGILAQAMSSSRTLREAIDFSLRYNDLIGRLIPLTLQENIDGSWTIVFAEIEPTGVIYKFCVEEALVIGMKDGGALVGQPLQFAKICLSYPEPHHSNIYRETFRCPVHFGANQTSITVASPGLDTPLLHPDQQLNGVAGQYCARISRITGQGIGMAGRVQQILRDQVGKLPTPDEVAARLNMSPRTLRRSLSEEGTTYRLLADQLRLQATLAYLKSGELTPKEIGFVLGFRDTNAFRRAFKDWSGKTLNEYRELLQRSPQL